MDFEPSESGGEAGFGSDSELGWGDWVIGLAESVISGLDARQRERQGLTGVFECLARDLEREACISF
jgi:hypothetical protein